MTQICQIKFRRGFRDCRSVAVVKRKGATSCAAVIDGNNTTCVNGYSLLARTPTPHLARRQEFGRRGEVKESALAVARAGPAALQSFTYRYTTTVP